MRNLGRLLSILFLLVLALRVVSAQTPVFRIGVLDDPRGPLSDGARLAVETINAAGGVRGADGTFFQLELIIQPFDIAPNIQNSLTTLSSSSVIAVIGPQTDDQLTTNLVGLQNLNVPILTMATGDTLLLNDSSRRIFRARAAAAEEGRALADYVINDLKVTRIVTVQIELDLSTTAGIVGFTTAAAARGITPQATLQAPTDADFTPIMNQIKMANADLVAVYGSPARAGTFYALLRQQGYTGYFAYKDANEAAFQNNIPPDQKRDIILTSTWAVTAADSESRAFREVFIRQYGTLPGAIQAAANDSVRLLAAAINRPGDLLANLASLTDIQGVQGKLEPAALGQGETSANAVVEVLSAFGAPGIVARYQRGNRVPLEQSGLPALTATPAPTATPDGVTITIKQSKQNVRSGPSTDYPTLGQYSQGQQVRVVGATVDFTWVVVDFRGQQGWLATYLLDVFGDLNTVPIITPPPTPTPPPSPSPLPQPDIVIDSVIAVPSPIIVGQPFVVNVTVRNAGSQAAPPFAVAATFPPNNIYAATLVGALNPGQSAIAALSGTFINTGAYSVTLVADLNNEVAEGAGESNNLYTFNYFINKLLLRQGSQTLNPNDTIDLEGNAVQGDANWDIGASNLNALFSAKLGIIANVTLESVHYDLITPALVNQASIPRGSMLPGTVIGVLTADGNRGALRVDGLPGNQLQVTFILFQN
jgi:ABC-type branched-subunit amino acid transport system substrate-binding protein/uncharacterized protein YgiM (DUF1202 family)